MINSFLTTRHNQPLSTRNQGMNIWTRERGEFYHQIKKDLSLEEDIYLQSVNFPSGIISNVLSGEEVSIGLPLHNTRTNHSLEGMDAGLSYSSKITCVED